LHPRHKTEYLWLARWEPPWIVEAKRILRECFDSAYSTEASSDNNELDDELTSTSLNVFDSLPSLSTFKVKWPADELTRYLNEDIENINIGDGIKWWQGKRQSYPRLSQMALDYLSIPGKCSFHNLTYILMSFLATSVDVERVFSRGRLMLTHTRSRLSAETSRAILCLGTWSSLDMVKTSSLAASLRGIPDAAAGDIDMLMEDGWDAI
jgi:hypothetical protein